MKRLNDAIVRILQGLSGAVLRFPLTVFCLSGAAVLICYMISLDKGPDIIIQKLMYTFLLGSFMGIVAQFSCERFERLSKRRVIVYLISALFTVAYYLILLPAQSISAEVTIRTLVAVFAMFCAFLWVPSYGGKFDFNKIALTHLKSVFTSVLYAGVLSAGCAAIIAAIDILLFNVHSDTYAYVMTIIWVLFATIYYLSLLPRFHSEEASELEYTERVVQYPRFLEILVSYIAIPLVAAYTLVLAAYFIKILVTMNWPSGQLGVMVLAYAAAGLIIYVLASLLENRFAMLYRLIFPKVLIPVVIMQLVSVAIRLNAYGFTESRYYVTLFGTFSIVCAIILSFKPLAKNGIIAVLAAGFAIFSVIPPVDAFTVSRVSQITRLENMLITEGILADGKLSPKAEVPVKVRVESTNILSYLESRSYIAYIDWLPTGFHTHNHLKNVLGFEATYNDDAFKNFSANLDTEKPIGISGYDICLDTYVYSHMDQVDLPIFDIEVRGVKYKLSFERISPEEVRVSVKNAAGVELVGTGLKEFARSISDLGNPPKEQLSPEKMTFDVENNGYKLRIVFQDVNITYGNEDRNEIDYSLFVMFGAPASVK